MNKQVYIAGPFFNDEQINRIKFIEDTCARYGIPYFSPRLHAAQLIPTPEETTATSLSGLDGLESSALIFASLDWLLPQNHVLGEFSVSKDCYDSNGEHWMEYVPVKPEQPDFNIADPGTCMEIGYAYCLIKYDVSSKRHLIGHLTKPTPLVNVMLTEICSAIMPSEEMIDRFLRGWASVEYENIDSYIQEYRELYKWNGDVQ